MYCSTITERFLHHTFLAEGKTKTPYIWHFQSTFHTCFQKSPEKDSHLRKPTVPKVTQYAQERTFPWHQCNLSRMCTDTPRVLKAKSCYTPQSYAHRAQKLKTWWKARFPCYLRLCTKDLEPRWAAKRPNCKQSNALSTYNEVSMTNVQNVHCCASSTVVLHLV